MKPFHVGLLVLGAAVAGGLAFRMSQAPVVRLSAARLALPSSARAPEPEAPPIAAPIAATVAAPSPPPQTVVTPAPPPLYEAAPPVKRKPFVEAPKHAAEQAGEHSSEQRPLLSTRVVSLPIRPMPMSPAPYQASPPAPEPAAVQPVQVAMAEPAAPEPAPKSEPAPPIELRKVTLYQGAQISVRLDESLSTDHIAGGDSFHASLAEPLVADGLVIAERGARVTGRVVNARRAGRLTGTATIELTLSTVQTSDGQRIAITTEPWIKQSDSARNSEAAKIGGGAALGAIIGALAGGGAGAAIGAGAGAVAGTGAAAATGGRALDIPSETVLRFRLAGRVTVTERPI
ncbi:MAG: hypothetical protein ABJC09_05005 [Terriglobia bacterium]